MEPTVHVFVFREGLLSRLGHDLRLSIRRFSIELDAGGVTGDFDLESLEVDGAMLRGQLDANALSISDRRKILSTTFEEVLHVRRFPRARLHGVVREEPYALRFEGTLELHGIEQNLPLTSLRTSDRGIEVELTMQPSRWSVAPYRALAGALKLQDKAVVSLSLPGARPEMIRAAHRFVRG